MRQEPRRKQQHWVLEKQLLQSESGLEPVQEPEPKLQQMQVLEQEEEETLFYQQLVPDLPLLAKEWLFSLQLEYFQLVQTKPDGNLDQTSSNRCFGHLSFCLLGKIKNLILI